MSLGHANKSGPQCASFFFWFLNRWYAGFCPRLKNRFRYFSVIKYLIDPCKLNKSQAIVNFKKIVWVLIILLLLGLSLRQSILISRDGVAATAVCINKPTTRRRSRGLLSIREAEFRFEDKNGQQNVASIWVNFTRPKPGAEVAILYSESTPDLIFYNSLFYGWMLPVLLLILLMVPFFGLLMGVGNKDSSFT